MSRGRLRAVLAIAVVAVLAAPGCREPSSEGPRDNVLRAVMSGDPTSLSLIGNTDQWSAQLARMVSDSLLDYDAGARFVPRLASSWEIAPDGLGVTFHLRDGVRWHDGKPVTSRDVLFTIRKVREPATQARTWASAFIDLVSIEAPDERTVVARYARPYADFLEGWRVPLVPAHRLEDDEDFLTSAFARAPVGCGPFRFVRWSPGEEIVLEANEDYWDGAPALGRLVFRVLPDERTAYQAILRGDVDLLVVTPEIWREARASSRASRLSRFVNHRLAVWLIGWNQDGSNPFFVDPKVRRAMVLALDRDRFASEVALGLGRPVATTYLPGSGWEDPSVRPWGYAPEEAARLLEEAGWIDTSGDGVREKNGRRFEFTMLLPSGGQKIAERIAAWTQQSLAQIGVAMRIERLEWRAFQERRRAHEFQAAMASLYVTPVPDQYELYHSTARDGAYNYVGFSDPEIDRWLDEGRRTFDESARRTVYDRIQRRLHELEPISPLFQFAQPVLLDPRLEGVTPSPFGLWDFSPGPRSWRWSGRSENGR